MDDGEAKISTAEIVLLPLDIHHPPISFEFKCESCVNNPGLTGDAFYRDLHALNVLDVTSFLSQFNCDNLFKNKSLDDMIKQNDPCRDKECLFGSRCTVNPDGRNATCICPDKCPNYGDHTTSRPVCGSDGVNYGNQCELQRAACSSQTNITIKFYGKCELSNLIEIKSTKSGCLMNTFVKLRRRIEMNGSRFYNRPRPTRSCTANDDVDDEYIVDILGWSVLALDCFYDLTPTQRKMSSCLYT
ncbi:follistatin-related protein 3-like [Diabrotica virgifera virgifera]|uniref:Kazal-like domain-containing protein n=1 Tax=Diabrotica virgifera virgifera TaxID=50390 RepID=A0ABM5L900_DIAVI|nr:follistatin-related protein 3-like [Diabrotica virgifera virgifera]